jgi:hypothetical protein
MNENIIIDQIIRAFYYIKMLQSALKIQISMAEKGKRAKLQ